MATPKILPKHSPNVAASSTSVPASSVSWVSVSADDGVSLRTCVSASGDSIDASLTTRSDAGSEDAVIVGRVYHTGGGYVFEESPFTLIPGSVVQESLISIPWGHAEYKYDSFEILTVGSEGKSGIHWTRCKNGAVPKFAVKGGLSEDGELLFIGRNAESLVDGRTAFGERFPAQSPPKRLVGKVQPSHGRLYLAFRGSEYFYDDYDVLTMNQSPASLQILSRACILSSCSTSFEAAKVSLPLPPKLNDFVFGASPSTSSLASASGRHPQSTASPLESLFPPICELVGMSAISERNSDDGYSDSENSDDSDASADETSARSRRRYQPPEGGWTTNMFPSISWKLD